MKKLLLFSICLVFSAFSLVGYAARPIVISTSNLSNDERHVSNFNGVAAGGPINVIIKLGNTESLRFEGDEDAIATLIAEVKSGVLIIRPQNSWTSWAKKYENKKITAYVTAKKISSLTMSGSGNMTVEGQINNPELVATLSGSGTIKSQANVKDFTGVLSGSGSLNFMGKANNANITISGSANFSGKNFSVNDLSAQISGSGSVNIQAKNNIEAVISGSGSIYYSGDAKVSKTVIGSGRIRKI